MKRKVQKKTKSPKQSKKIPEIIRFPYSISLVNNASYVPAIAVNKILGV